MNSRILASFAVLLLGFFLSCGKHQQEQPTKSAVSFRPALLVVDIQNEYLPMMDKRDVDPGMEAITAAIQLFRKHRFPVIRVYNVDPGAGPEPGTEAFEFPRSVPVTSDDPLIVKNYPSAFTKTSLDSLLKDRGCNAVYVCGLSAVGCVLATYFGGMDRGYDTYMVREAIISHDAGYTDVIRNITSALPLSFVDLNMKVFSGDVRRLESIPAESLRTEYGVTAPDQLNIIGYILLSKGRFADAIVVLQANVRLFPDEPNCYDSLGDAYERNKQKDLALVNYEQAVERGKKRGDPNLQVFEKNYRRLKDVKR